MQSRAHRIGRLDRDANHEAAAAGVGANLEHCALLAGADAAQEAKIGRRAGLRGGGDVADGGEVYGGGGVFWQNDVWEEKDDDVGEGLRRGESVEE